VTFFDHTGLPTDFGVEVDPEFPGTGAWGCPVIAYDSRGQAIDEPETRWGTPVIVRFNLDEGEAWVAMFASDGLGQLRQVHVAPGLRTVVVAGSTAFLVDPHHIQQAVTPLLVGVHQVTECAEPPLLLLVSFTKIVAIGQNGVAWTTARLCLDGLEVLTADRHAIVCAGYGPDDMTVRVDPTPALAMS
jgi:hypothetical protein